MLWIILSAILVLYLVFALLEFKLRSKKICAVCGAVSLNWIVLLLLSYLKMFDNKILIAILMGQSICGAMYLFEKSAAKKWHPLRIVIILLGTLIVYYLVKSL